MRDEEELKCRNPAVAAGAVTIIVVMLGLVAVSPVLYRLFTAYIGSPAQQTRIRSGRTAQVR
jgi:hypothetical protein